MEKSFASVLNSLNELDENKILELILVGFSSYLPDAGSIARLATIIYTYMCVCVYVYVHMYVCIYKYTYIYIYIKYFPSVLGFQIMLELETWVIKKVFP